MKQSDPYSGFEQGPIRPPSESGSLLIRATRNCPWNRCTFCGLYKGKKFSLRPVAHVLMDIDRIHNYVQEIKGGPPSLGPRDHMAFHAARNWVENGMKSIFLQDSNSLIMKPDDLVTILTYLNKAFPETKRVTSYARSHTIARISDHNLARMAGAGLNRIHIGMESAEDRVLALVKKGTDKETQIRAGKKVKQAGMELSEYFMPGIGGKAFTRENALETADAINQINPDFIRLRTLAIPDTVALFKDVSAGTFQPMDDRAVAQEILLFIQSLEGINSTLKSDHILNLFQEVQGKMPRDKHRMTAVIERFLCLDKQEQMLYQIGRRSGLFSRLDDLDDPTLRTYAEWKYSELNVTEENIDSIIADMMNRFI
jgi:Radical SAM superfamily